jgi:hypothetical protein
MEIMLSGVSPVQIGSAVTDFRRAWLIMRSSDLLHKFKPGRIQSESGPVLLLAHQIMCQKWQKNF